MASASTWDSRIGRRVRLQDLHVLFAVVQCGSMAKAAAQLRVSQSAVSQMIGNLEAALGVPLLERSSRGVQPTPYGTSLLKRGRVAFDELRQAVRDIETLADPRVGEIRLASPESISSELLPVMIRRFLDGHPAVTLELDTLTVSGAVPRLRDRSLDLFFTRGALTPIDLFREGDLSVEPLFNDEIVIAAGTHSPWSKKRKLGVADLAGASWLLPPSGLPADIVAETFTSHGIEPPVVTLKTFSVQVRAHLVSNGPYVTTFPKSVLQLWGGSLPVKALPIALPSRPYPVSIVTLRNRSLSPAAVRFVECARAVGKEIAARLRRTR